MLGCCVGIYKLNNREAISKKKFFKNVEDSWNTLMDSIGSKAENKKQQRCKIMRVIKKSYGFDSIVSLPIGFSCKDFRTLIPLIQQLYMADVIAEPSSDKNSIYMRVKINAKNISEKDEIRFKWYKYFHNTDKFRNVFGETYKISGITDLISPTKELIGYKLFISIPDQLTYSNLVAETNNLSKIFSKCFIEFDEKSKRAICNVITNPVDNKTKFIPIKVEPWQLYIGIDYNYQPIVLDYKLAPNTLIAGSVGSGKTMALISAFINLCCCRDDIELNIGMISEKEDLRIFKNVKQCKNYCNDPSSTVKLLKDLNKEMSRRNKLFAKCETYCSNIYKYNSLVKKSKRLKIIHFISDEIADLMDCNETQELLWNLIRKSRSAGIYITLATQRASIANISPEIKAQLSNKICFSMTNSASALTVLSGEGLAARAIALEKTREFIADYNAGFSIGKTLYLTEEMMVELLKDKFFKDNENKDDVAKNSTNAIETINKPPKSTKDNVKINKNEDKIKNIPKFKNINSK